MIKLAQTPQDVQDVLDLLRDFLRETAYDQAYYDREHLGFLVYTVMQHGFVWLAYHNEQPAGLLIASYQPNMWAPKLRELRELVWFVRQEYRETSIGGRLFMTYCQVAEQLLEEERIDGYFTTQMATTRTLDLESRGFRLTERTYIKE